MPAELLRRRDRLFLPAPLLLAGIAMLASTAAAARASEDPEASGRLEGRVHVEHAVLHHARQQDGVDLPLLQPVGQRREVLELVQHAGDTDGQPGG